MATDPNFDSVVALLHFDGADGGQVFTDVKGNVWTAYQDFGSSPTIATRTAQFKFGTASCDVPVSANSRINTPDATSLQMGSGPFTIEAWFRPDASNTSGFGFFYIKGNNAAGGILLGVHVSGAVWRQGAGTDLNASVSISTSAWTHIAFVRDGTARRIYINGTLEASDANGTYTYDSTEELRVGSAVFDFNAFEYWGYIDDLRVTKGVARYSSNFTAPTAAFPDS